MVGCNAEKLISLTEERLLIYDLSMKHKHSIRGIQDELWEEMLTQMDISGKYFLFIFSSLQYSLTMLIYIYIVSHIYCDYSNA